MKNGDQLRRNLKLQLDENPRLRGLDAFKRNLEREYFARVAIRNCHSNQRNYFEAAQSRNLVIDLECNLTLVEMLYHLDKGNWGQPAIKASKEQHTNSAFQESLATLCEINTVRVDVEEVSLLLKDILIVIKSIYANSIGEQIGNILKSLAAHYVYFTRDLTETPYEIYLPVFEEEFPSSNSLIHSMRRESNSADDYFGYWALYFESLHDAKIYDLQKKAIISGDLHMLNQ